MFDDLIALCLAASRPALPQDWWSAWSFAPGTLLPLLALLAWLRMRKAGRLPWAGSALLALAMTSPLCRLAATLAAGHMAQLMLIIAAAALLASGPPRAGAWPAPGLRTATALHGVALWLWHVPPVYALVLQQPTVHVLAYALLVLSGWCFWRAVLHAPATLRGAALLALLATMAHTGLLGALLTFAGTLLYPLQAPGARAWGLAPLEDQQLAGLLMWVLGGAAYLGCAVGLALHWWAPGTQPLPVRRASVH
jgi:putative membrane protein